MQKKFFILSCAIWTQAHAQSVEFISSDTALQNSFYRAKELALSYRGNPADPVGPWYEAALPSRNAFCIRDVAHQSIGAEILGMSAENKNMFTRFVSNISESKDWCTFWEINKFGKPAPEDYRNDTAFWYNLNANFELIDASWRLYQWTGDRMYIDAPAFRHFFEATLTSYITRWQLQADSLLTRPQYMNTGIPFNVADYFHRCRGLPSYYEARDDIRIGVDLIAAIARGYSSYAAMQSVWGNEKLSKVYARKAAIYNALIDAHWWNNNTQQYNTYYTNSNVFGHSEGAAFLLWYDALKDPHRISKTMEALVHASLNVENASYLSYQLCRYGYAADAYKNILYLMHPATPRREYPEVSYGVIEGIVQGVMGVSVDAGTRQVSSLYNYPGAGTVAIKYLPVLGATIHLKEWQNGSALTNNSTKTINWKAAFRGDFSFVNTGAGKIKTMQEKDLMGNIISYVEVKVLPGESVNVKM